MFKILVTIGTYERKQTTTYSVHLLWQVGEEGQCQPYQVDGPGQCQPYQRVAPSSAFPVAVGAC